MKLEFKGLSKQYENKKVLENIDLSLENVSKIAIIGPSGGGKTTLLRMIAGLETQTSGNIILNDVDYEGLNTEKKKEAHRATLGFVFQAHSLFSHMTVLENITFPQIKLQGKEKSEAELTACELLERFGLLEHKDKLPSKLSGGQQQRVAIIRAIAIDTKILLFDEPTSALDPVLTEEVLSMIAELNTLGKEFIIVTHALGFAKQFADYTLFVDSGKIIEAGSDIISNPTSPELTNFLSKVMKY